MFCYLTHYQLHASNSEACFSACFFWVLFSNGFQFGHQLTHVSRTRIYVSVDFMRFSVQECHTERCSLWYMRHVLVTKCIDAHVFCREKIFSTWSTVNITCVNVIYICYFIGHCFWKHIFLFFTIVILADVNTLLHLLLYLLLYCTSNARSFRVCSWSTDALFLNRNADDLHSVSLSYYPFFSWSY